MPGATRRGCAAVRRTNPGQGSGHHYRIAPGSFYGFDLAVWLPSHLLRTWYLQLAIPWIATTYVAGALFLASGFEKAKSKSL